MTPIDLIESARGAVFVALQAGLVGTGATARDHVKQDSEPPFVMIGEIEWVNEGGKDNPVLKLTIEIITIYRGADRAQLLAIMHANYVALDGAELIAPGVSFDTPALAGGSASGAGPDGVTYAGIQIFEFYAEPA